MGTIPPPVSLQVGYSTVYYLTFSIIKNISLVFILAVVAAVAASGGSRRKRGRLTCWFTMAGRTPSSYALATDRHAAFPQFLVVGTVVAPKTDDHGSGLVMACPRALPTGQWGYRTRGQKAALVLA